MTEFDRPFGRHPEDFVPGDVVWKRYAVVQRRNPHADDVRE